MRKISCLIVFLFSLAFSANAQEVDASLESNTIRIGEQTNINLEIRCSAAVSNIMLPALKDTISKFVEIVEVSQIDTTFDEDDITTKIFTQKIRITSWDSGYHAIPPFVFVVGNDTLKTKALLLTVNTIPIQAEQDIKDIKSIINVPFSLWDWILTNRLIIGLIGLSVVLLIIGLILYKKYANRPKEEKIAIVPKEAADVVANRKLEELASKKLWQDSKVKAYYSELSFIVREYIENRFELAALESTTDEIITMLSNLPEVDGKLKDKLHQVLLLADMAKFAKQQPIASENEDSFKFSQQFVSETAFKEIVNEVEDSNSEPKVDQNA